MSCPLQGREQLKKKREGLVNERDVLDGIFVFFFLKDPPPPELSPLPPPASLPICPADHAPVQDEPPSGPGARAATGRPGVRTARRGARLRGHGEDRGGEQAWRRGASDLHDVSE